MQFNFNRNTIRLMKYYFITHKAFTVLLENNGEWNF